MSNKQRGTHPTLGCQRGPDKSVCGGGHLEEAGRDAIRKKHRTLYSIELRMWAGEGEHARWSKGTPKVTYGLSMPH